MAIQTNSWRPIALIGALFGALFAVLTITGSIHGVRATQGAGLSCIVVVAIWTAWRSSERSFLYGFLGAFSFGLVAVELQAVFIDTYFANNPTYKNIEVPFGWPPRIATAVLGPLNAAITGLIGGVVAFTLTKIRLVVAKQRKES